MKEKNFNEMLNNSKDMPKIQIVADIKTINKYGGNKMFFAPPITYDEIMRRIPIGKVITTKEIRKYLAEKNNADFTDPMTAGIFINLVAMASEERNTDLTPYWRTLKTDGFLNEKYPGGIEKQKEFLEKEGHEIGQIGKKNIRYYVKEYRNNLFNL